MKAYSRTDENHARAFAGAVARVFAQPTSRQNELIDAMFAGYFHAPELRASREHGADAEWIAAAYDTDEDRRVLIQMLILIEMCRGSGGGEGQAVALERLAAELEVEEEYLLVGRDAALGAVDLLTDDWTRIYREQEPEPSNAGLRAGDPAAVGALRTVGQCATGSVGHALLGFYARHGHVGPADPTFDGFSFAPHDFHHTLANYGTTEEEETGLLAFLVTASGGQRHFSGLTAAFARQEWNALQGVFFPVSDIVPEQVDFTSLVEGLVAGERVAKDFTAVELLDVMNEPIDDVRREYGIPVRRREPSYAADLGAVTVPRADDVVAA